MNNPVLKLDIDYNNTFANGFETARVDLDTIRTAMSVVREKFINTGKRGGIYGASASGEVLFEALDGEGIDCFYDLAPNKNEFHGLPAPHPHDALWYDFVIVAVSPGNYLSVLKTLSSCLPPETALVFPWAFEFFDPVAWMKRYTESNERIERPSERIENMSTGVDLRGAVHFDGSRVFRTIYEQEFDYYVNLLRDQDKMRYLKGHGLVETSVLKDASSSELLLEHKALIPHTHQNWTMSQYKDATLFFLDWWQAIIDGGFSLQDCHSGNVMFDHGRPLFVDFCSIGPAEATTISPPFIRTFYESWLTGLCLIKSNQHQLFREAVNMGWKLEACAEMCGPAIVDEIEALVTKGDACIAQKDLPGFIRAIRSWVETVSVSESEYGWNNKEYQKSELTDYSPQTEKEQIVADLMDRFSPQSYLDLGCNKGRYSMFALQRGMDVVALDTAESLVDKLYLHARESGDHLHSFYWDLKKLSSFKNPDYRFGMVAYLALVHHLVFSAGMTMEEVVEQGSALCENVLLFEYIEPVEAEPFVYWNYNPEKHPYYTPEGFRLLLEKRFDLVEEFKTTPSRILFVASR